MRRFWIALTLLIPAAHGARAIEFDRRLIYSSGIAAEIEPCG